MRDRLIQIQRRERLTDKEMAARLEVARSTWTDVKNGRLAVSDATTMAAARAFPELIPALVVSLSGSANEEALADG